jgi:hypothetical protein
MKEAVLLIVYNRPEKTKKILKKLEIAKPPRLYIAADGPNTLKINDSYLVKETRKIIQTVRWKCKVHYLLRSNNLGCKYAVSQGIDWFFKHETKGIILEDDCLPNQDFFIFCENLLNYHKRNKKIFSITGTNFYKKSLVKDASYYFSIFPNVWGWATWRRSWKYYDVEMKFWPKYKKTKEWKKFFNENYKRKFFEKAFDQSFNNKINTWDYQFTALSFMLGGLTATPTKNLIKNIGFGSNSTFNKNSKHRLANLKTQSLKKIYHPSSINRCLLSEKFLLKFRFNLSDYIFIRLIFFIKFKLTTYLKRIITFNTNGKTD